MTPYLARAFRSGRDRLGDRWDRRAVDELCALLPGVPVRCYMPRPGFMTHPAGPCLESVIGRVASAWSTPEADGVLVVLELDDSPRAVVIDAGLRRMAAAGILARGAVGLSVMVRGYRVPMHEPPAPPAQRICGIVEVLALDFASRPDAGGALIRALEPGEDPRPTEQEPTRWLTTPSPR